jgi:TetR/AcrR family transcriptional regulator, transcriptional repressor for nem operon
MPRNGSATRERILDAAQRLVLERGFAGTSVDAVLAEASVTKGGFFHHFPSKQALGLALVERYAALDLQVLEDLMATAEAGAEDPAEQVVAFVRLFEEGIVELATAQPGCLFGSFVYERELAAPGTEEIISHSIHTWRERVLGKLEEAAEAHPPAIDADLPSLADQIFTTFQGGFILARAENEPEHLRRQLAHVRHYLELLFQVAPVRA